MPFDLPRPGQAEYLVCAGRWDILASNAVVVHVEGTLALPLQWANGKPWISLGRCFFSVPGSRVLSAFVLLHRMAWPPSFTIGSSLPLKARMIRPWRNDVVGVLVMIISLNSGDVIGSTVSISAADG